VDCVNKYKTAALFDRSHNRVCVRSSGRNIPGSYPAMGSARLQCCQQHLGKRFVFIRVTNENVTRHFTYGCYYLLSKVSPLVEAKAHRCQRQA